MKTLRPPMDPRQARAVLIQAAYRLENPTAIVPSTEAAEMAALKEESLRLKARIRELESINAKRVRLDDATICAGYRRYEAGPETAVLTLVGHRWSQPTAKRSLLARALIYVGLR